MNGRDLALVSTAGLAGLGLAARVGGSRSTLESRAASRATRHAAMAKRAILSRVVFQHGGDSFYRDQYDGYILAVLPSGPSSPKNGQDAVVGRLDWSRFRGRYSIKMVEVVPTFRRLGLATRLYAELFRTEGIEASDLEPSWRTPEGDAFRKGVRFPKKPARGSRAMRQATPDVGLAIGDSDEGTPAVLLLDLAVLRGLRTRDDLRSAQTRVEFPSRTGPAWHAPQQHTVVPGAILGYIRLGYPKNEYGYVPCGDASDRGGAAREDNEPLQVTLSAAVPGWGPLLYDCALLVASEDADNGFLIPDRGRVFDDAEAVWKHYIERRRGEIVVRPVPKGCEQYGDYDPNTGTVAPHPHLDQMVRFRKNSRAARAVQPIFERGRDAVRSLAARFHMDVEVILADLVDLGEGFFSHRFDG